MEDKHIENTSSKFLIPSLDLKRKYDVLLIHKFIDNTIVCLEFSEKFNFEIPT